MNNIQAIAPSPGMHPLTGEPRVARAPQSRKELADWFGGFLQAQQRARRSSIRATYDAASENEDFARHWANADLMDADSANSQPVRQKLVSRSRYEVGNNGFADGIAQTYATHLVGAAGPVLRMQTASEGFNRLVETQWFRWCKAVGFSRKFWCMAHAKHTDGEAFAVIRRNPRVQHPVKLDLVLHETEQCRTPVRPILEPGYIDGIKFDEFGNPLWYDFLRWHPGATSNSGYGSMFFSLVPEHVPAEFVLHWFKLRRPGQHRGVPECSSTLNLGAAARRYRNANLATAEKIANFTLFLKTMFEPDTLDSPTAMSTLDIEHGMMTALPNSVEPYQLKAEHPPAGYGEFNNTLIGEQARAKNMPLNVAKCDSSNYNYASGRLDHQTYYSGLDRDREDGSDVLDKLFVVWFRTAVATFQWLGGNPDSIDIGNIFHQWDWPKHRVADIEAEANANQTKLHDGSVSLSKLYTEAGEDFEDELLELSADYGLSPDEMRKVLLAENFPNAAKIAAMEKAAARAAAAKSAATSAAQQQPQGTASNA